MVYVNTLMVQQVLARTAWKGPPHAARPARPCSGGTGCAMGVSYRRAWLLVDAHKSPDDVVVPLNRRSMFPADKTVLQRPT